MFAIRFAAIFAVIALLLVVLSGLAGNLYTPGKLAKKPVKQYILVAKKTLEPGVHLSNPTLLFQKRTFLAGEEPKGALTSLEQIDGKFMKRCLRKGDFVTAADLADEFTDDLLPEGMSVITVRTEAKNKEEAISLLGSRVDILWTPARGEKREPSLLIENALVCQVYSDPIRNPRTVDPSWKAIALILPRRDCRSIVLASEAGTFSVRQRQPTSSG